MYVLIRRLTTPEKYLFNKSASSNSKRVAFRYEEHQEFSSLIVTIESQLISNSWAISKLIEKVRAHHLLPLIRPLGIDSLFPPMYDTLNSIELFFKRVSNDILSVLLSMEKNTSIGQLQLTSV